MTCRDQYRTRTKWLYNTNMWTFIIICPFLYRIVLDNLREVIINTNPNGLWPQKQDDLTTCSYFLYSRCFHVSLPLPVLRLDTKDYVICEPGILLPCYRTSMTRFCQQACCADTQQHFFEDLGRFIIDWRLVFIHAMWSKALELMVKTFFAFEVRTYSGTTPHTVTVTARCIPFLVGNPHKPSFVTVTRWRGRPKTSCIDGMRQFQRTPYNICKGHRSVGTCGLRLHLSSFVMKAKDCFSLCKLSWICNFSIVISIYIYIYISWICMFNILPQKLT